MCFEPFLLLDRGEGNDEIMREFKKRGLTPQVHFTTWDDYAVMSMVESGLGISILPELILKRCPYKLSVRPLEEDAHRTLAFAVRNKNSCSLATRCFLGYLSKR